MLYQTSNPHGGDLYGRTVKLDFSVNTNPLGTPLSVVRAVEASARHLCQYPDPRCRELTAALASYEAVGDECVLCGSPCTKENPSVRFSIKDGGIVCQNCGHNLEISANDTLIYPVNFGIVDILKYFQKHPMKDFQRLALEDETCRILQRIMKQYLAYGSWIMCCM